MSRVCKRELIDAQGLEFHRVCRAQMDDQYSASQLRNRYAKGGASDSELSASQLRARHGIENNSFEGGSGALPIIIGVVVVVVIVAVFFMNQDK